MKAFLEGLNQRRLQSYSVDPGLLKEHYGIEQTVLAGGYGYRQILELVQNGADAILEARQHIITPANNDRIHVLLRDSRLYVANTGAPLSEEGLDALLRSHSSPKRGNQIGRFGLGFKSLLRLDGRIDLFTRTSGAIRFDPQRCREELRQQFKVTHAPSLRLAWPLDEIERGSDSTCTMLAWAETIVRAEVRGEQIYEHLRQEIRAFPAEFLLFFPVATVLTLEDGEQPARVLRLKPSRGQRVLHDGAEKSRWRVSEREIRMTDAHALADATHIHARERVPLAWAFPLEGRREETGRFWAFFPTHTASHVPGILNAPWKLNNDRKNIIGGEWNTALMAEAAGLVADTLPKLSSPSDPGRLLDAFPRQLGKDEDAAPLVEGVWKAIEKRAVIPDGTGKLRIGVELWRHPRNSAYLARDWQALATAENASRFIHPSCLERQRNSRLNALAERLANGKHATSSPNLRACEASLWFKAVASVDPAKATAVLKLAEGFASECKASEWNSLRPQLAIVPSENGQLLAPSQVVLAPEGTVIPGRERVASALYNDTDAKRILANVMGVQPPGDNVWEEILSESIQNIQWTYFRARDTAWKQFWVTLRAAPLSVQNRFIDEYQSEIRIHQRSGEWVTADEALLPGALIQPDDTSTNQNLLVDQTVHGKDGALLAAIGVCELPDGVIQLDKSSGYLSEWLEACRARYKVTYHNSASRNFLEPVQLLMPKGFGFLTRLVGTANARLTEQYLRRLAQGAFCWDVELRHSTEPKYPKLDVPHPLPWFVLQYGLVEIGNTTARLSAVMARQNENVLSKLSTQAPWAAALHWLNDVFPRVAPRDDEIRELWLALIAALATPATLAGDSLLDLWIAAANDGVVPEALPSAQGRPVPLGQIFVTSSPDLARRARLPERIVVTLDESTLDLWIDRGARNLTQLLEPSWNDCIGPALLLTAAEPELTDVLRPEVRETARCQVASALELKVGETADPVPCLMWKGSLFLDAEQLAGRSRAERLSLLLNEIAPAGWLTCTPEEALQHLGDARVDALRTEVAQGATLVERLLRAVGNRREPLLKALGALKDLGFLQRCAPLKLAELVLAQLGPATLTTIKETLSAEGLNPPARWNTSEARAFVASIGFPAEFAAAPETKRGAEETISGPIDLPRLHDFQEEVMQALQALLASSKKRRRAVVSLPTGGGKTRVTVEASVRLVLVPEGDSRSVIWVAQTDELCEQAVQAFRQVWVNLGAQRTDLRIVRLWGGNPNPAIQASGRPVVGVASIQTLNSRMGIEGLAWLRKPGLVVVDECHHAIAPSYSNLLHWLDADAPRRGARQQDEPPLIGLSATPFRTDDEESQRLAKRFDNRWLPAHQEELHARLRRQGALAEAVNEELPSGARLLKEETERLAQLPDPWEGLEFENLLEGINRRLAGDQKRNERLVEHIRKSAECSILFFTNSVQHAEEMSARLNLAGISAAAVSGSTPAVARRHFLDRFQRREIRVLCNHSVLSTGFDTPRTDMVLISRQVFSPVRYMQMVGRGLRGEKNGGTARCRIVTVVDNLGRYQDRHPYHFCRQYFSAMEGTVIEGESV